MTHLRLGATFLFGALVLLGGCDSIPDAVNPVAWFSDDEKKAPSAADETKQDYPKLGSVPKRPPSLEAQQAKIAKGLKADLENARYTDEKLQREATRRAAGPPAANVPSAVPAPRPIPPTPQVASAVPQPVSPQAPKPAAPVAASTPRPVPPPPQAVQQPVAPSVMPQVPMAPAPEAPRAPSPPVAAPQSPAASQPAPPALRSGETLQVGTIYFRDGSTKLQTNDVSILQQIAAAQRQTGSVVKVVGHASGRVNTFDASRRHLINYQVSVDRAHAVAAALLRMGVPVGKLQVEGKGDTAPLYAEYTPAGEAANRRAEVYFVN